MTLDEAWAWLSDFTNLEKAPSATKRTWRLDRMDALLADRGHPEKSALTLHLAGSKGKGSTAAYLSSILTTFGLSAGLYSSPHVRDWRERITNNGTFFEEAAYARTVDGLFQYWNAMDADKKRRFLEDWGGPPTTFEWLTLAAFELFTQQRVEARVLETGLGGRLDATNAQVPSASILTLIELEHTEILGDTLALIAAEKAGILKKGVPAFVAPQKLEVLEVFRKTAKALKAPLHSFDEEIEEYDVDLSREGTFLRLGLTDGTLIEAQLPLLGRAQGLNAAVAAWTIHALVRDGQLALPPGGDLGTLLRRGLEATRLPGRMQVLSREPWVVLDGAHTAESTKLLARSWEPLFGNSGTLVFGAFEGKAIDAMASNLAPLFPHVIVTKPGDFRPSDPEALRRSFLEAPGSLGFVDVAADPAQALQAALIDGGPVLVCGSFYLVGEVLKAWEQF